MNWGTGIIYFWLAFLTIAMTIMGYIIAVILTELENIRKEQG